jgi:hypothetical protein
MKVYLVDNSSGDVIGGYEALEWGEDFATWQNGDHAITTRCGANAHFTDTLE